MDAQFLVRTSRKKRIKKKYFTVFPSMIHHRPDSQPHRIVSILWEIVWLRLCCLAHWTITFHCDRWFDAWPMHAVDVMIIRDAILWWSLDAIQGIEQWPIHFDHVVASRSVVYPLFSALQTFIYSFDYILSAWINYFVSSLLSLYWINSKYLRNIM